LPISKKYSFLIAGVVIASIIGVMVIGLPQDIEDSVPKPSDDNVTKPSTVKSEISITSVDKIKETSELVIAGISKVSSEGTQLVEVKLDDGEYFPATPNSPGDWSEWSITLDTSTLDDGTYNLVARVMDNSGNEELDDVSFNLNLNPITITNPPYDVIVAEGPITITGNIDTQRIEANVVEVKIDDGEYIAATPNSPGDWSEWSITLDTSTLDDGTYNLVARAIDDSGNEEWDNRLINYLSSIEPIEMHDDFSDGKYDMELGTVSPDGNWFAVWHDEGYLGITEDFQDKNNNVFVVESGVVGEITDTKSAMILSTHQYKNFKLSVDVRTDKQTRLNDPPNAWEVGWLVWTYKDPTHFNYFLLKTNGAEMGKYDGGVNPTHQKILFTNSSAQTSIGDWTNWQVLMQDSHMTIFVDDVEILDFYDFSSFDTGRIGFYLEDASVSFDNFEIVPLP
jgi:hypothetical protein